MIAKQAVSIHEVADILNSLLKKDREALTKLLNLQVKTDLLGDDPEIVVTGNPDDPYAESYLDTMNLINSFFGYTDNIPQILTVIDENKKIIKFIPNTDWKSL